MVYETLKFELVDGIATVTLNRPDRMNAFTRTMADELMDAFDRTDADDDVRAVIVTGAGDRAFCAGADLAAGGSTFDYKSHGGENERQVVNGIYRDVGGLVTLRIFDSLKPVIGAVNGVAVGVGASMLLPMDVRIASDSARFGYVFSRRGIAPDGASAWFLPRIVGISTALNWSMSGRVFPAQEALDRGLVDSVHEGPDLLGAARRLATELTSDSAPVSVAVTRRLMWRMVGAQHPMDAHRADSRAIQARGASGDAREGVSAFREKRPAVFPDRVSDGLPDMFVEDVDPVFS
jgi:enoyl-CoA hydratase/carnithine racemase